MGENQNTLLAVQKTVSLYKHINQQQFVQSATFSIAEQATDNPV